MDSAPSFDGLESLPNGAGHTTDVGTESLAPIPVALGRPWAADTKNVRRILGPILRAGGIQRVNDRGEHVDVHSLRHTAATRLARAGLPMAKLQRFMGHQDPRTTQRYYDHLEVEDLEAAFGLVPELPLAISGSNLATASAGETAR